MKRVKIWGMVFGVWALILTGCGVSENSSREKVSEPEQFGTEISYAKAVNTKITSSPLNPSNSPDATFKFKCNKKSCAYKCQLDGGGWLSCKSPKTYPGLADGAHNFKVKAKDKATGKWDKTPASYNWTISTGGGGGWTAVLISAGYDHTCALTSGGGVKCWGDNYDGQLGDGTNSDRNAPVDVFSLSSGVSAIEAGSWHTCALTSGGAVKCWGDNSDGQLGNDSYTDSKVPVDVSGLSSGVIGISAGYSHTCALISGGAVKCWGNDADGQLGNGANGGSKVPVDVSGLSSGVTAISAGWYHTCALISGGAARCWGANYNGQLGDGTNNKREVPTDVSGLTSGVNSISSGMYHTCALVSGGAVKCWGDNDWGQLGDGSNTDSNVPVNVSNLSSGVSAISVGGFHNSALISGGGVKCWGANYDGQLGDGSNTGSNVVVDVSNLSSGVSSVSAGESHTCALVSGGAVKCWGDNFSGQLGDGTNNNSNVPVNVVGF